MRTAADVMEVLGAVLIVAGLAVVALPLALIVAGFFLMRVAYSLEPVKVRR